jgi:quercetin dioxygenase-like cupin family protein
MLRAMKLHRWSEIPVEPLNPLLSRQAIHSDMMTISRLSLKRGAIVPRHSHVNEQVTMLQKGRLRFVFDDGQERIVEAGDALQIASDAPHLVEALEDSEALDLFAPPREDWIRGDDNYLRR